MANVHSDPDQVTRMFGSTVFVQGTLFWETTTTFGSQVQFQTSTNDLRHLKRVPPPIRYARV